MDMDAKEYLKPLLAGEQSADEIDYIDEVCGILDNDHDLFSFPSAVDVHFLNIQEGTFFNKVQSRVHNIARMRVENGIVNMVAISLSPITNIQVSVFREPKAAELHGDRQGKVQLPVNIQDPRMDPKGIGRHYFSVDLDDVYEGPLAPVYALAKNDTKKRNLFQLGCIVYFVDGSKSKEFFSKPFLLKTKERPPKRKTETTDDDVLEPTPSRPRQDSDGSGGDSGISQWSPGDSSGSTSPLGCQAGQEIVVKNLRVVDHLEASRAKIDYLTFSKMKPQGNADLGYHIQLGDPEVCGQYREGDVVAFCEGENGQTEIELLTNKNINSAFLAGVISRSAYLEAKPRGLENAKTDVVCVIGVVKVNCMGKVQAGERVYATVDKTNPGVAIPESSLPLSIFHGKENGMLGMALETKNSAGCDEMQLVRCFVCIVLGVQNKQLTMEIENMYDEFEMELMIKLRKERKKTNKIVCGVAFALLMLLGLVGVLLYQLLYPGTAMRYWLCKQGCIPDSTAQFTFIPYRDITQRYHVRGVQFKFEDLLSKLPRNEHVYPVTNKTGGPFRYYLNIDRCAYGGSRLSGTILADQKQVGGAKIFAVNFKCTKAYYFQNPPHGGWKMYQSVEKYFKQSLKCYP